MFCFVLRRISNPRHILDTLLLDVSLFLSLLFDFIIALS